MSAKTVPDRALLLRAVRWARLPGHGHTIAQACKKFGITASVYRRAARELGAEAAVRTDEELVLSGLHPSGATVESLIYYYDWINHAGISPADMVAILKRLITQGLVRRKRDRYELAREWP
ncbi:MAG: hypothetical protein JWN44_4009 [Myxococcales bacterium]|nr:hypothetical protein [Myxococcales bacterium]